MRRMSGDFVREVREGLCDGLSGSMVATEVDIESAMVLAVVPVAVVGLVGPLAAVPLDVTELATLLRKEQLNSYGVLAAQKQVAAAVVAAASRTGGGSGGVVIGGGEVEEDSEGERWLRGSAMYAQAGYVSYSYSYYRSLCRRRNFSVLLFVF